MFMLRVIAVGALVVWSGLAASTIPGDARRGEQLFQSEQCIQCHSVKGKGGTLAPDLARRVDRDYTPAVMASLMWNHAPANVGGDEAAGRQEGEHDSGKGRRPVRLLCVRPLLRKAGRCGARQAGLRRPALRRLPRHHQFARRRRAASGQVGIAGRPGDPGAADVEPRPEDARGIRQEEAGLGQAHRSGTDRHAGLPAEPAGDPQPGQELLVPAVGFRREAVRLQGLHGVPHGQPRRSKCCSRIRP